MATSAIRVFTHLTARVGQEAELRQQLLQLQAKRCRVSGCHQCDLLQHNLYSDRFIIVEEWDIEARLRSDFHPESESVYQQAEPLLAEMPMIEWYEVIQP